MSSSVIAPDLLCPPAPRPAPVPVVPRWLHWWALLTLFCALPLILLGTEVTNKQIGMVDVEGFRAPWHLFTAPLRSWGLGYLIEHSHRLVGFVVGICCIVLAFSLQFTARRPLLRWMGWVALLAVSTQGVLGILRVNLNARQGGWAGPELALVHGCFAQLVLAVLVGLAVLTSRSALESESGTAASAGLRRFAVIVAALVYLQVIFGAMLRHLFLLSGLLHLAQRLHFLLAFAVLGCVLFLVVRLKQAGPGLAFARRWARALEILVALQIVLGIEAWLGLFGSGRPREMAYLSARLDLVRSGHYLIGLLVFTTTVVVALLVNRVGVSADPAQEAA